MSAIKLNEAALLAAGFDRATVQALRHLVRQVGPEVGATTLPQVAETADLTGPVIIALQIGVAALQAQAAIFEAEQASLPPVDADARRLIADLSAEAQERRITADAVARRLDDLGAELQEQRITASTLTAMVDALNAELQEARTTNNALSRRIDDLENGVN
jgi:hypothetical protein